MTDYTKYTDQDLKELFVEKYKVYRSWSNSQDGSDGACWEYEVKPIVQEWERRGYDYQELAALVKG